MLSISPSPLPVIERQLIHFCLSLCSSDKPNIQQVSLKLYFNPPDNLLISERFPSFWQTCFSHHPSHTSYLHPFNGFNSSTLYFKLHFLLFLLCTCALVSSDFPEVHSHSSLSYAWGKAFSKQCCNYSTFYHVDSSLLFCFPLSSHRRGAFKSC